MYSFIFSLNNASLYSSLYKLSAYTDLRISFGKDIPILRPLIISSSYSSINSPPTDI